MQRKYKKKNDSEIKIRLPEKLKNDFYECCELLDAPVAEVIRVLMSDFMKENHSFLLSKGLFPTDSKAAKRIIKNNAKPIEKPADKPVADYGSGYDDSDDFFEALHNQDKSLSFEERLDKTIKEGRAQSSTKPPVGIMETIEHVKSPKPLTRNQQKRANKKSKKKR